jgi:hypothetical protein
MAFVASGLSVLVGPRQELLYLIGFSFLLEGSGPHGNRCRVGVELISSEAKQILNLTLV